MSHLSGYNERWFETFAQAVPDAQVSDDADAICEVFPIDTHDRLLEIGCGLGRHASELTARGYDVVAIDRSEASVDAARAQDPAAEVVHMDMRELDELDSDFDGCFLLWHSFGYFDEAENARVAGLMADRLRPRGRILVDLFNPGWAVATQGSVERRGHVHSHEVVDGRQISSITYPDGSVDHFDWQLYTPSQFDALMAPFGFQVVDVGVWWDFSREPTDDDVRFQLVLDRV